MNPGSRLTLAITALLAALPLRAGAQIVQVYDGPAGLSRTHANKAATDISGNLHWVNRAGGQIEYRSTYGLAGISDYKIVSGAVADCDAPTIAVDWDKSVGIFFVGNATTNPAIYYTFKAAGGTFSPPFLIASEADSPSVVANNTLLGPFMMYALRKHGVNKGIHVGFLSTTFPSPWTYSAANMVDGSAPGSPIAAGESWHNPSVTLCPPAPGTLPNRLYVGFSKRIDERLATPPNSSVVLQTIVRASEPSAPSPWPTVYSAARNLSPAPIKTSLDPVSLSLTCDNQDQLFLAYSDMAVGSSALAPETRLVRIDLAPPVPAAFSHLLGTFASHIDVAARPASPGGNVRVAWSQTGIPTGAAAYFNTFLRNAEWSGSAAHPTFLSSTLVAVSGREPQALYYEPARGNSAAILYDRRTLVIDEDKAEYQLVLCDGSNCPSP